MKYKDYINSSLWKERRKQAYDRANHKCELCGSPASAVHHVEYPKQFENDSVNNLLVVCDRCHKLVHGIRSKSIISLIVKYCLENGLLVDKDILDLLNKTGDIERVKIILGDIRAKTNSRVITKEIISEDELK